MNRYLKEVILWVCIALPYIYLAIIWQDLPEQVPIHFNREGVPNGWSGKTTLLFIPGGLCIGVYLLMLLIPILDPKKKIQEMGAKYYSLRFMLTFLISLLAIYVVHLSYTGSIKNPPILYALVGTLFVLLGNYFQTIRPNYFIGIRTPWTLDNENVWRKTHRLGGRLWVIGGLLIAFLAFIIPNKQLYSWIFKGIIAISVLIPILFSFTEFQKEKNNSGKQQA